MKILFLGAGKRLSLLEAFLSKSVTDLVRIELHSVEASEMVPISTIAKIHVGPKFDDPSFGIWLIDLVSNLGIDIVIPNMDSATVALSQIKKKIESLGSWAIVSDSSLCISMQDKQMAEDWFVAHNLPVPMRTRWPRILKKRLGFASRGQVVVNDINERDVFLINRNLSEYIEQNFVAGDEYTVDAYVSRDARFINAMSRMRLKVSDGEVEESLSSYHPLILDLTEKLFSFEGWQGPLTAQFIDSVDGPILIEVNPRFGGGVTHSIHCGLNFPEWLVRERLGLPLPSGIVWQKNSLMTRCRRDIFL